MFVPVNHLHQAGGRSGREDKDAKRGCDQLGNAGGVFVVMCCSDFEFTVFAEKTCERSANSRGFPVTETLRRSVLLRRVVCWQSAIAFVQ